MSVVCMSVCQEEDSRLSVLTTSASASLISPPACLLLLFNLSLVWEELHMQPCTSTSQVTEYLLKLGARRVNTQHC